MCSILLQQVRTSCRKVAEQASYVHIDEARIRPYAVSLPVDDTKFPLPDGSCHYLGHGVDTVAFFVTLNAINFGSGYFPYLLRPGTPSGYFTVASRLNQYFIRHGPFTSNQLLNVTAHDCKTIFAHDFSSGPVMELMELFAGVLRELGYYLVEHFGGSFAKMVDSAGFSVEKLVRLLVEMPSFADIAQYKDVTVSFLKRAQITAADLFLAFQGRSHGRFDDIDCLTIFADNLVPHVLRRDGILHYHPTLLSRIERGDELPSGSHEEIEIRACAIHCCELLIEELKLTGKKLNSLQLDQFLWNRGQLPEYKMYPRHRTRTVFY